MILEHSGNIIGTNNGLQVIDCRICGYAHLDPLPSPDYTRDYYNRDVFYSEYSAPDWFEKERLEHVLGLWEPTYKYQAQLLMHNNSNRFLLDIGCGAGYFLRWWQMMVGHGFGIEPSSKARNISPVHSGVFSSLEDLLVRTTHLAKPVLPWNMRMALVLEHIPNAKEFLKRYVDLMCGGRLMIIVPSDFSPLQKRLRTTHFISSVHCNYFSPRSLRGIMNDVGLRVISESVTAPMEMFILAGRNYLGNDELGRRCHRQRLEFEKRLGVKAFRLYNILYRMFGIGRELVFVGEKA